MERELEEGQVFTKSAHKSMHARLSDFVSWGNQRDEARTHQFEYVPARLDKLRSDFIMHQQYIDKSKELQKDTRATLKALDQRWVSKQPPLSILSSQRKPGPPMW